MRTRQQAGFTVVEVIVAIAVSSLVIASILPVFLLVNRVITTWTDQAQARAVGLIAEQTLTRDLRQYGVAQHANDCKVTACRPGDQLILEAHPGSAAPFCVSYAIASGADSSVPLLVRSVLQDKRTVSTATVAHGVSRLATRETRNGWIRVDMTFTGFGGRPVDLRPPLLVTPRLVAEATAC